MLRLFRRFFDIDRKRMLRRVAEGGARLHLGCGANVLDGWVNIDDVRRKGVYKHDLRQSLPLFDFSVQQIYSEHFIEHLTLDDCKQLLRECFRLLRSGGFIRISTPDLEELVSAYQEHDVKRWESVGWLPTTPCQMFNEGMRLWGHMFLFDFNELAGLLRELGFEDIKRVKWGESTIPDFVGLESRPDNKDLIIEARKP